MSNASERVWEKVANGEVREIDASANLRTEHAEINAHAEARSTRPDLAWVTDDQKRINAQQVALGALENPLKLTRPDQSITKFDKGRRGDSMQVAPNRKSNYDISVRTALQVAAVIPRTSWLLRPYLEHDAISILYGDFGTFKSFVVIDWAMRVALGLPALGYHWSAKPADVLLISGEGRALPQRLRGWCIRNFPDERPVDVLGRTPLHCVEHPVNFSEPTCAMALVEKVDELKITPSLVIIDTMSRNSDGRIENSTTDAAAYLVTIDQGLRSRYGCAVLLTHHVGHVDKGRIRGPIVLAANTDTLIRVERPDASQRIATLTVERLKDAEPPDPQGLRADIVDLGENDEDGQAMTTLALNVGEVIQSSKPQRVEAKGKAQRQLLAAVRAQSTPERIWTADDIREVARLAGMHRNSARKATEWIVTTPLLKPTVGGWKLADA